MRGFFAKYPQMHLNKNTGSHATIASIHSPKAMMTVELERFLNRLDVKFKKHTHTHTQAALMKNSNENLLRSFANF